MLASLGNKIGLEPQLRYHGITLGAHTTDGCVSGSSLTTRHVQRSNPPRPRIHPAWKQFGGLQSFQVNHLLKSMGFLFIGKKNPNKTTNTSNKAPENWKLGPND